MGRAGDVEHVGAGTAGLEVGACSSLWFYFCFYPIHALPSGSPPFQCPGAGFRIFQLPFKRLHPQPPRCSERCPGHPLPLLRAPFASVP